MKKLFVISIILVIIIFSYENNEQLLLKDNTTFNLSSLAVYLENEEGEYEGSSAIPSKDDGYTFSNAVCENNIVVEWNSDAWAIIVPNSVANFRCNLYFDIRGTAADLIESLYANNQSVLAYDESNNLRYIGIDPSNYVLFNNELWRIIGVFNEDTHGIRGEKLIKLVKNDSIGEIAWDNDNYNNWNESSLNGILNSDYFYSNGSYANLGLDVNARDMVETVTWKLGGVDGFTASARTFYESERGNSVDEGNPVTWQGKVALIYPSDYVYATGGSNNNSREECLSSDTWTSSGATECSNNNWLYKNLIYWTLTHRIGAHSLVFAVGENGIVYCQPANASESAAYNIHDCYPSVYLKSEVSIIEGNGSKTNPYILA